MRNLRNMKRKLRRSGIALAVVLTAVLVVTATPATAASPALNFQSEKAPNPTVVEDELTISEHDRNWMDQPLEYYDDSGDVSTLNASLNSSQTAPMGVRWDKVDAAHYDVFPRIDAESNNWATWTASGNWTKSSGASSSVTISDASADGVDKVSVDATVASTETATATFARNVSITEDPTKRVLTFVGNVDSLSSGSHVHVRVVDADGDYHYANISQDSLQADSEDVIANSTGNGYVFQQRVSELPSSGTLDEIEKVEIVTTDANAKVTIAGLDVGKKSEFDLAEIERDTDGDSDLETTVVTDYYEGGVSNITSLNTLGSEYSDAVLVDFKVYDVQYKFSEMSDSEEYSVDFSSASNYSYDNKLEVYADLEVPSAIDLSHGSLTMEFEQGVPGDRYVALETANVDTTEDFGNISESTYTDHTGSLSGSGETAELITSPSSDTNYRFHAVILLQGDDVDELQSSGAMGPTGSSGSGFFSTAVGQFVGIIGSVLGAVGAARYLGIGNSGGS